MTLNLQSAGDSLIFTWPFGTLLESTNMTGPWITNPAASPFTNHLDQPQMFYRVRVQ